MPSLFRSNLRFRTTREKQKPLTMEQMMQIQLGMADQHEERPDRLENTMNIDYAQQKQLKNLANEVVVASLGGKGARAYKYRDKDGCKISKLLRKADVRIW